MSESTTKNFDEAILLPAKEVAALLGVSERTVHRLRSTREIPQPVQFGGSVRWRRSEIARWIDAGCSGEQN